MVILRMKKYISIIIALLLFVSCNNKSTEKAEETMVGVTNKYSDKESFSNDIYSIPLSIIKKYPNYADNEATQDLIETEMASYIDKYIGKELPMILQSSMFLEKVEKDGDSGCYRALFSYGWISDESFESKISVWITNLSQEDASKLQVNSTYKISGKLSEIQYRRPELRFNIFDFGTVFYEDATLTQCN